MLNRINEYKVEKAIRNTYAEKTGRTDLGDTWPLSFRSLWGGGDKTLAFDGINKNALLVTKLDLSELLNFDIDITPFEKVSGQLSIPTYEKLSELSKYGVSWCEIDDDYSIINYPVSTIKKFIIFRHVTGLSDLSIEYVILTDLQNGLIVRIANTHPFLKGEVKISTW